MKLTKGQLQITAGLAMSAIMFIASPIVAYFSAQASTQKDISAIETKTQVVSVRVDNVDARLDRIEKKLDGLLENRGINPNLYEK